MLAQTGVDIVMYGGVDDVPITVSYGPWAERQRDLIMKYMFPPDYQDQQVTLKLCRVPRVTGDTGLTVAASCSSPCNVTGLPAKRG